MTTMTPRPTQMSGATFLANEQYALLADEPRVGKTGAAIIAADFVMARHILVITTASGRGVWRKGFDDWSVMGRSIEIATKTVGDSDVIIVGWPSITKPAIAARLLSRRWDLIISDEDHYAKSFDAQRTKALYGQLVEGGAWIDNTKALYSKADAVWTLTGTPLPHSPADTYPRLRALSPERLKADPARGWPDVTKFEAFRDRYCVVRMKKLSNFNRIPVVVGGRNLDELRERMAGFFLLRTQKDVGITEPVYDFLPLIASARDLREIEKNADVQAILDACRDGSTKDLEMHLGPLRRITGQIKAGLVVEAVKDEFECGLDKIVLAYWHKDVGAALMDGLHKYGVTGVDGSTPPARRDGNVKAFSDGKARVFLAQIEAAGEAIDLSASAVLWFVETTFSPRSMKQMALRITNHGQMRQPVVKVACLQGSIDEALQARLLMLWTAINEVMR